MIRKNILKSMFAVLRAALFLFLLPVSVAVAQQIEISRINTMPDFPQPYHMRNWKVVAQGYDSLVFNENLSGQHLPLVFFRSQSVNYPEFSSFGLHTAVGTNAPTSGEGINVIAAVVGASLVGIDKSDQFGENWAMMIQEYFNRRPQENIYLNHPSSNSGYDWWYETMPNIFFLQLKSLYPQIAVFQEQLPVMASQWARAVRAMGASDAPWTVPYMNYRAWNMAGMQPLDQGVKQPEAAGALAWILYNSYVITGNPEYLKGAEWSLEFLDQWPDNPSYELQLPYGIYTAARMNAEMGTQYNVEQMLNWAFDRGALRGWGAISGNWGGYDVHGLIGEANDNGNDYAFMMNGYQQAAALVPMVRYDQRFARAIAKWVLNMANASRLFYPAYLPANMQDNASWAQTYDPDSWIGYEALREIKNGQSPFATGDAIDGGWAQTNLMLYGSSHVGYLAAIIDTTNVEGILQLDLLKTDFYGQDAFSSYLYYNPLASTQSVNLYLPAGTYKIYDLISKEIVFENQSGIVAMEIPADAVFLPVVVPQSAEITMQGRLTLAGDVVIDFHNGQATGFLPPRIKALAAEDSLVVANTNLMIYCTATDPQQSTLTYHWYMPGDDFTGSAQVEFNAPAETGAYTISCKVTTEHGLSDSLAIVVQVVEKIPYAPEIISLTANPRKIRPGESLQMECVAEEYYNEPLSYIWFTDEGTIAGEGAIVQYTAPAQSGDYYVGVEVSNPDALAVRDSVKVMIRDFPQEGDGHWVAYYPLHGNANDYSGNSLHASPGGGLVWVQDMNGNVNAAAGFNGTLANILMPGSDLFNFTQALGITTFIKVEEYTTHEQHPISHGSWENRYKVSFGNQKFRFTLNTSHGIRDLDTETLIEAGRWHHLAVIYNGADMELWLDGKLDAFTAHTGQINASPYNLVLGQNIPGINNYNFKGAMSLFNLYDYALTPSQILENLSLDADPLPHNLSKALSVFPNPVTCGEFTVLSPSGLSLDARVEIFDMFGRLLIKQKAAADPSGAVKVRLEQNLPTGIYVVHIIDTHLVYSSQFMILRTW